MHARKLGGVSYGGPAVPAANTESEATDSELDVDSRSAARSASVSDDRDARFESLEEGWA